ncbi:MAG: hypothetical protein KAR39_12180 [Thermoplasmata archaeon]|nr:hypothetical protein [Thermoplasmata archaeon]
MKNLKHIRPIFNGKYVSNVNYEKDMWIKEIETGNRAKNLVSCGEFIVRFLDGSIGIGTFPAVSKVIKQIPKGKAGLVEAYEINFKSIDTIGPFSCAVVKLYKRSVASYLRSTVRQAGAGIVKKGFQGIKGISFPKAKVA